MATDPKLHIPLAELLRSGGLILTAGETDLAVSARLPALFISNARTLWTNLGGEDATQAMKKGASGDLTKEETAQRDALKFAVKQLKDTAKKAFSGQDVKLHDEFQIGITEPHNTGELLRRGAIMLASAKDTANAAALQAKGYGAADRQKLEDVIGAFRSTDTTHETAKNDATDATGVRTRDGIDLLDRLETIQNAASLEYPVTVSGNAPKRTAYLLGKFPPKSTGHPPPPPPPATLTATGFGDARANGLLTRDGDWNGYPAYVTPGGARYYVADMNHYRCSVVGDTTGCDYVNPATDVVTGTYTLSLGTPPAGTVS